ncbi:hypothetical protein K438DRAFT_1935796 [Mycena galopus ATCC 62051]|nr:hypothetical protein K438DRAFT_1935796 [Mycena galopus ATCC 62051]
MEVVMEEVAVYMWHITSIYLRHSRGTSHSLAAENQLEKSREFHVIRSPRYYHGAEEEKVLASKALIRPPNRTEETAKRNDAGMSDIRSGFRFQSKSRRWDVKLEIESVLVHLFPENENLSSISFKHGSGPCAEYGKIDLTRQITLRLVQPASEGIPRHL